MGLEIKPAIMKLLVILMFSSCAADSEKNVGQIVLVESQIDESGEMLNGVYMDGKKYGFWLTRFPNGSPKYERYYIADTLHGLFIAYHENGNVLESGQYEMGIRNGVFKRYYSNGSILDSGAYMNDAKLGVWEYYIESSEGSEYQLCYRIQYKHDDTLVLYDAKLIPPLSNGEAEWTKW